MVTPFNGTYAGKRVLVTGHSGFKGGWLSLWLHRLGAEVSGLSLPPPEDPNLFSLFGTGLFQHSWFRDLREPDALSDAIRESQPDIVFHLAAQPIVGASYRSPLDTFTTNALGTALLLEAVRSEACPAAVVIVTSDKCYRNDNSGRLFVEDDPLGGHDVYSMSKAAAELVAASWHASFFARESALGPLATARAGNVIGGGDYAEDRILPDAVRAFTRGGTLTLRRPEATRPWQHVLESVSGYLALGQRLLESPEPDRLLSFNFGPDPESERTVQDLVDAWLGAWPDSIKLEPVPRAPYPEAVRLGLDHSRASQELGWHPVWAFPETVRQTAAWYRLRHEQGAGNNAMLSFTEEQIDAYVAAARQRGSAWAASSSPHTPGTMTVA